MSSQRGRSEAEAQKQELLQRLHVEGQALLDSVSGLDEDELSQSGVVGEWSAQDVIAHVGWWERQTLRALEAAFDYRDEDSRAKAVYSWLDWSGGLEALNAQAYLEERDRSLDELLADHMNTFNRIIEILEAAPADWLTTTAGPNAEQDSDKEVRIARDTCEHFREHASAILDWRRRTFGETP